MINIFKFDQNKFIKEIDRKRFQSVFAAYRRDDHVILANHVIEDCYVVIETCGVNASVAAAELMETAIMSHKHLARSDFYYDARKRLMDQQLKVVARNITRMENNNQVKATISIFQVSNKSWWIDIVGKFHFFVFEKSRLERLLPEKLTQAQPDCLKIKGVKILGLQQYEGTLLSGQKYILINDALVKILTNKKIENILNQQKNTGLDIIANKMLATACKIDKNQAYGIYLWEKTAS